jgi:hypothetical protein
MPSESELPPLPDLSVESEVEVRTQGITLKEFLEGVPPGGPALLTDQIEGNAYQPKYKLLGISLDLHCDNDKCGGTRIFRAISSDWFAQNGSEHPMYLTYRCQNCEENVKLYSVIVSSTRGQCSVVKLAEKPNFGPPTPAKVFNLIGAEREFFLKGRRAENQGLGIGAFSYYRRVVENQKDRILEEIIRASRKIGVRTG